MTNSRDEGSLLEVAGKAGGDDYQDHGVLQLL